MDVAAWLRGLGLGQYEQTFRENDVDAEVLMDLTAGIPLQASYPATIKLTTHETSSLATLSIQ